MSFAHLEVHSHYSLLSATPTLEALVARAASDGLPALCLADTGALYGAVAFDRQCRAAGIHPVLGLTLPTPLASRGLAGDAPAHQSAGRLVLLADGPQGYRSLCRISSLLQADPERERLWEEGFTWKQLALHRDGLFALSGGRDGAIERALRAGNGRAAMEIAARFAGTFDSRARLALEVHSPADLPMAHEVVAIGRRLGVECVVSQPILALSEEDAARLRLLAAIRANTPLDQLSPEALRPGPVHWVSPETVSLRYSDFPEAVAATGELAAACRAGLPDGKPIWPDLALPAGESPDDALRRLAQGGLHARFGARPDAAVSERLDRELMAIAARGYAALFLVVADVVRFSRHAGIPVSTRGSVANSLVAYASGITTVDPIEHDLLFERFLSPARADVPDIDLDFCSRRRDEVLDYVRQRYGADRVAIIGAMSTMQLQSAIRETGKAYDLPEEVIGKLAALAPRAWHPDPRRRDRRTAEDVLAALDDPLQREVVRAAYTLVGQPDHLSLHPGGVVITPGPLTDILPVQMSPKGFTVTQYEHGDIERLGLPKIDLLGIRALTVLADAAELVRRHHDPGFRVEAIPLDDAATGALLAEGETIGVFQCESEGAQSTLRKLRAHTVRDLAVANAFFKPGPATGGMAGAFVRRYRGEEPVRYLHPSLAGILEPTRGVLLFQEQILRLATEIAGLTWQQADQLRKGMSHFGADQMEALRETFVAGCMRRPDGPGLSATQAGTLWEQVAAFAGYGFNQGHATAYADVSYRSAYLKRHWPAAFLAARLADHGGFHHPAVYIAEARRLGIGVRPPHVNHSESGFCYDSEGAPPTLWMGLGQVRDLTRRSIERLLAARADGPFTDLSDLVGRVELRPQEITHLIQCGALDGMGADRHTSLARAAALTRRSVRSAGHADQLALPLEVESHAPAPATQSAALPADPTLLRDYLQWEQHLLGFPVSVHPLDLVAGLPPDYAPLAAITATRNTPVVTAGARLPGWTGGRTFYLSDTTTFLSVGLPRDGRLRTPAPWQPVIVHGRRVLDAYGNACLFAEQLIAAPLSRHP